MSKTKPNPITREHVSSQRDYIVQQLRELRERRGVSQQHLGDMLGLTRHRISDIENNLYDPTLSTILRICRALGTTIDQLCDGTPWWE